MPRELPMARIVAGEVQPVGLRGPGTVAGGQLVAMSLRMEQVARHLRASLAKHDRHQHWFVAVVAEAVRPVGHVQHHVLRAELRLDDLVVVLPGGGEHARQNQEGLFDLVRMQHRVLADRLVHHAHREMVGGQGVRVAHLGRAAGTDEAHLCPVEFREAAAGREGVPVGNFLGMPADVGAHRRFEVGDAAVVAHGEGCWHGDAPFEGGRPSR